jgi:hypothetical protein
MRRAFIYAAAALLLVAAPAFASHAHHGDDSDSDAILFKLSGLQFPLPPKWIAESPQSAARAGQWQVPPPRDEPGESGEVVAFFFGQGIGGSAKENIDAWTAAMITPEGNPATADVKDRTVNGTHITQAVVYGTYSQPVPIAGMPPLAKTDYCLVGAVVESPLGDIYWRFTGPATLVTANLPLFNQMIDSVKPQDKPPAP